MVAAAGAQARPAVERIREQDPRRDNLVDPAGQATVPLGQLGSVKTSGHGRQHVVIVAGLGFGAGIFDEFTARHADALTFHAVTLPGFGGTLPPPSPPADTSFGAQTWTNAAVDAVLRLIDDLRLERPVLVGHWLVGTQIVLRVATRRPEAIKAIVLFAGSAAMTSDEPRLAAAIATPAKRVAAIDSWMAPRWFKTVTRETWDDNNFLPGDYAVDPVRGLRLWRAAAAPPLHVWVRWLCEWNAQDITQEIAAPPVPTLLLQPVLRSVRREQESDYMPGFLQQSWQRWGEQTPNWRVVEVADARACLWFDQPDTVDRLVREFVAGVR